MGRTITRLFLIVIAVGVLVDQFLARYEFTPRTLYALGVVLDRGMVWSLLDSQWLEEDCEGTHQVIEIKFTNEGERIKYVKVEFDTYVDEVEQWAGPYEVLPGETVGIKYINGFPPLLRYDLWIDSLEGSGSWSHDLLTCEGKSMNRRKQ